MWTSVMIIGLLMGAVGAKAAEAPLVCVSNNSDMQHFFAAESPEGQRSTGWLSPGGILCAPPALTGVTGTVSVFEHEDALEGCSRRVTAGLTEEMRTYADFDRCLWSSNAP